ncbi:hypothetical protein BDV59DRAFT_168678 [Aspergillus ambiguus]|uniref:uncharacterized protein n=1 Tax=Aspergillus ambiguus TaxID=176160 RepID=UPI003CCE5091
MGPLTRPTLLDGKTSGLQEREYGVNNLSFLFFLAPSPQLLSLDGACRRMESCLPAKLSSSDLLFPHLFRSPSSGVSRSTVAKLKGKKRFF